MHTVVYMRIFFNNNDYEVGVQDTIGKSCCYVPSIIVILFIIHLFTLPWVWTFVLSLPPPVLPAPTITILEPLNSTTLTLEWQVGCSICTRENHGGFQWMLFLETSGDFKLHLVAMPNSQWRIRTLTLLLQILLMQELYIKHCNEAHISIKLGEL